MKKFFALILAVAMLCTLCACGADKPAADDNNGGNNGGNETATVKFGAAIYVSGVAATDATEDKAGQGAADVTAAAVTVDKDGKIVACDLDTMQNKVTYTTEGKAVANDSFKTKYELGDSYNMVTYGGATQEWYKQADAFEALVAGKTVAEIKALVVADTNKGTDEVVNAGCTIMINDFVSAIEKAVANAKAEVVADVTVKVALNTTQTCTDATEEKAGSNQVEVYTFGAALKDGKVVSADSDCVQVSFGFDIAGKSTFDASKAIQSKREQGDNYNMVAYGGAVKEWYAQADAFDAACEGKTGSEIAGLMAEDYKGIDSLKSAGCTIYVSGFVAAASKI